MSQALQSVSSVAKQIDENVKSFLVLIQSLETEGKAKEENVKKYQQQVIQLQKSESKYLARIKNLVDENTSLRMQVGEKDDLIRKYQDDMENMNAKWKSILNQYHSIKEQMKAVKSSISKSKTRLLSRGEVADIEKNCDELQKAANDASKQVETSAFQKPQPSTMERRGETASADVQHGGTLFTSPTRSPAADKSSASSNNSAKKKKSLRLRRSLDFEGKQPSRPAGAAATTTAVAAAAAAAHSQENIGSSVDQHEELLRSSQAAEADADRAAEAQSNAEIVVAETPPEVDYNPSQNSPILIRRNEKSKCAEVTNDVEEDVGQESCVSFTHGGMEPSASPRIRDEDHDSFMDEADSDNRQVQISQGQAHQESAKAQEAASAPHHDKKRKTWDLQDQPDGKVSPAKSGGVVYKCRTVDREGSKNSRYQQHPELEEKTRSEGSSRGKPAVLVNCVTRKKAERADLRGFTCDCCDKFFGKVSEGSYDMPKQHLCQQFSRHRYQFSPPKTPPSFWRIGFTQSQPIDD